ncbi:MAG TPA: hypothetical protein VJL89_00700 [Thermodesulfovibrionia bacterium]|nr:hypothetical protein [Thermodesulfovibrionia bacterium]
MNEIRQYVVVMGVSSIKKYVFGTNQLVEIRGASALLDHLNRSKTQEFLEEKLGKKNVIKVFAGGGAAQFILYAAGEDEIDNCLYELETLYHRESAGGLRLITGKAEFTDGNYAEALQIAEAQAQIKREEVPFVPQTLLHMGYISECQSCSETASEFYKRKDEAETRLLCKVCYEKTIYGDKAKKGLWADFSLYLQKNGVSEREAYESRPKDFDEIGQRCSARQGYTAVVYADGNAMGKIINNIENMNQFRFFSETVDTSIREACHEALFHNCKITDGKFPADILLLGGDDLIVCLTAEAALPFAIEVANKFNLKTKESFAAYNEDSFFDNLKGNGMTISLGIAYGKSHTPFSILFQQAEELLSSAKKEGSQDNRATDFFLPTYIDFHLSTNFNQIEVSDCRKKYMELEERDGCKTKLYMRPYSLEDAEALLKHARTLAKELPSTRLYKLGNAPLLGRINGTLEFLRLYIRIHNIEKAQTEQKQTKALSDAFKRFECLQKMPWNEVKSNKDKYYTTVLVDLMEIACFCKTNDSGNT